MLSIKKKYKIIKKLSSIKMESFWMGYYASLRKIKKRLCMSMENLFLEEFDLNPESLFEHH